MKKLVLILALAGCSTPIVEEKIVEVEVPVNSYPVKPTEIPSFPKPLAPYPGTTSQALDLAVAKICEYYAYALAADPLMWAGAGLSPKPMPDEPVCRDVPAEEVRRALGFDFEAQEAQAVDDIEGRGRGAR